jgi:2-polyprenyl-3-methyl-5-hydroxy-6-metoxy-1,4-benzoquinol methylase
MQTETVESRLLDLARRFPAALVDAQLQDVRRAAFQIGLVEERAGRNVRLCDIGSGVGLFPAGCALLGMHVTMIDDFQHPFAEGGDAETFPDAPDSVNYAMAETALDLHRSLGIDIQRKDAVVEKFDFPPESLDVVTCFESMEHWHHSPKRLFAGVREALVPGGLFILSTPNAVNLRKRITVLLGRGKWSEMAHWYETERFRGHVREPDVGDLRYVARDMALAEVEILGRNWAGYINRRRWVRLATPLGDHLLRLRPSLCSDIYLIGRKPR